MKVINNWLPLQCAEYTALCAAQQAEQQLGGRPAAVLQLAALSPVEHLTRKIQVVVFFDGTSAQLQLLSASST
jgi:hypothetical protein